MGLFDFLKKKDIEQNPSVGLRAPVNLPNPSQDSSMDQAPFNPPNQENFDDMPHPPNFESFDDHDNPSNETEQITEQPFNPNVPSFNSSNEAPQEVNSSKKLPNPFDMVNPNDNQASFKRMPTFAEQFGTKPLNENLNNVPNQNDSLNQMPFLNNQNMNQVPNQNIIEEKSSDEINELPFPNQNDQIPINKNQIYAKHELPLYDDYDNVEETNQNVSSDKNISNETFNNTQNNNFEDSEEINELSFPNQEKEQPIFDNPNTLNQDSEEINELSFPNQENFNTKNDINPQYSLDEKHHFENKIDEHVEELNKEKDDEIEQRKREDFLMKRKLNKIPSSVFLSIEDCSSINDNVLKVKNIADKLRNTYSKVLDLEKDSEKEYSNWKKDMESIYSYLISMDKKIFR